MDIKPPEQVIPQIHAVAGTPFIELLRGLGRIAEKSGFHLYALGGAVRDIFLHRRPEDLDFFGTTSSNSLAESFIGSWGSLPPGTPAIANFKVHPDVGLAKLFFSEPLLEKCHGIDLLGQDSAFRPLSGYDATRLKDFPFLARISSAYATLASLAVSLNPGSFGTLYDEFGGLGDIKKKQLRLLSTKELVPTDLPTIIKLIGLSVRIDFAFESASHTALMHVIQRGTFDSISKRSLFARLCDVLKRENPERVIRRLLEFELGPHIFPPIEFSLSDAEAGFAALKNLRLKDELIPIGAYEAGPYALLALVGTSSAGIAKLEEFYELGDQLHGSLELCCDLMNSN